MIRFTLQISDQLNTWLTEQARLNHHSKNKQIEHLLELARRTPINNKTPNPIPPHALEIIPPEIEQLLKAQRSSEDESKVY